MAASGRRVSIPWPFGPDTALDRARTIARHALDLLDVANPPVAADLREMAVRFGEGYWLSAPAGPGPSPGELLTTAQVAALARVEESAVSKWSTRGIVRGGVRHALARHPGGYLPADVDEFLLLRDTPQAAVGRDPEDFCRCGHDRTEHELGGGACVATAPDRCSCAGFRLASRARC